jgi:hypothetical protein
MSSKRPTQNEIDLGSAPGVSVPKDKKLDKLGSEFIDVRDQKAALAETITALETKIFDRMDELDLKEYRFADQVLTIKNGSRKVKVKTVKVESDNESETTLAN